MASGLPPIRQHVTSMGIFWGRESAPRWPTSARWRRPRSGFRRSTCSLRVFELRALAESSDVQSARAALRNYIKGGTITTTPESFGDGQAYVARAEFLPLVLLTQDAATPSELEPGGRCPRWVARGGFEPPTFGL